ncbi:MAG: CHAT domain-containing protein [Pirellulaceae bacterium]
MSSRFTRLVVLTCAVWLIATARNVAEAQLGQRITREYPPLSYYVSMELYEEGEFTDAMKAFRSTARSGVRSTEGRWVDSICYHAMIGECYYQLGDLGRALDQYTAALNLYMGYSNWMLRVDFPQAIDANSRTMTRPITWGATTRRTRIGRFSDRYPILQGNLDNTSALVFGGVFAAPEFWLINAHEIVRCTALAIRRRSEITGAACRYDPLTTQLVQALSVRPTRPNHWSQAWVSVLLGLAYAAEGKADQATSELQKSLSAGGQFDHPLTATALLELGKIAYRQGQHSPAATYFLEATMSAAWFEREDVMEEAFRWGTKNHLMAGSAGPYAPLQPATVWAERMSQFLTASLLLDAAHVAVEAGKTAGAAQLLKQSSRAMARTDMMASSVGLRFNYLTSLASFQARDLVAGDQAFAAAMKYQRTSSLKLFEIGLIDRLYTSRAVNDRIANDLFAVVLRDPTARDWRTDPLETITAVLVPPFAPLEHWFAVALKREETETAFEIADRIRRRRFYASLPMGGRLLAFRWVLEAPLSALSEETRRQRQDLLAQNPLLAELARRSAALKEELRSGELVPAAEEAKGKQKELFTELAEVSQQQEILLREMALRRWPSDFVFPPALNFEKLKQSIPEGVVVLSFLNTRQSVYGFGISRDSSSHPWQLQSPLKIRGQVGELLRQMGQMDRNQPVDVKLLQDDTWKETAAELLAHLTRNAKPEVWERAEELVVVPDGPLWYLPFEALQVDDGGRRVPLISKVRVRYAPTLSLILPDDRGVARVTHTAVVRGRLFPHDDDDVANDAVARMRTVIDGVTDLAASLPVPSGLLAPFCQRLVVLTDIDDGARGAYDWSPMQLDRGKSGSTLANWMTLPWGGPEQIVLPGFHTPAESGLKRGGSGDEVFLAACGLMATGSRTILLSRWRSGGKTNYDLVREFVQELPFGSAAEAWQRAVQVVGDDEIVVEREPRVNADGLDVGVKADHPFFWAGYLLIDTGGKRKDEG